MDAKCKKRKLIYNVLYSYYTDESFIDNEVFFYFVGIPISILYSVLRWFQDRGYCFDSTECKRHFVRDVKIGRPDEFAVVIIHKFNYEFISLDDFCLLLEWRLQNSLSKKSNVRKVENVDNLLNLL